MRNKQFSGIKCWGSFAKLSVVLFILGIALSFKFHENQAIILQQEHFRVPVLIGREYNPLLRLNVRNTDKKARRLKGIRLRLNRTTDLQDIDGLKIFSTGEKPEFDTARLYAGTDRLAAELIFSDEMHLKKRNNFFWVSIKLNREADLFHRIGVSCVDITVDGGEVIKPRGPASSMRLRIGVAVRKHGDDGVHTYRIPGLATGVDGTLLAIYDVRRNSSRDLQGDIDIGLTRSADGGQHWEPMQTVLDMDEWGGLPEKFNGVSDACILVDRKNGHIFIAGLWMHGVLDKDGNWIEGLDEQSEAWNHQWRDKGSQPGYDVKQTSQFLITKSSDGGKTWEEPVNLTYLKKEEWWLFAPAPGNGITMSDGTLVFPTQGRDEDGLPFSNIMYSKDGGKSWKISNPAYNNTTESAVAQLSDGSLMLNMRDNRNRKTKGPENGRAVFTTRDLGQTWQEHPTSHGALQEPVCMASLIRHEYHDEDGNLKSVLLFSNPNDQYERKNMTIKVSFDDGMTWPQKYWLLLDEGHGRGYSCLTSIDERHIGILYEGSRADMTFQEITLDEILKEK